MLGCLLVSLIFLSELLLKKTGYNFISLGVKHVLQAGSNLKAI